MPSVARAAGPTASAVAAPAFGWLTGPTLRYGLTVAGASVLALYLAILFDLDQPYWAATTVLIVAQPAPGQVVGKGIYRAIGTIVGAAMGTVLIGAFAQTPELFVAALAGWTAACTGVATLLRGFRSYGAVLSGYTAAIVAVSALGTPERVFDVAVARGSAILLGILCGAALAAVLLPSRSRGELLRRTSAAIADAARLVAAVGSGTPSRDQRRRLVADLAAVELLGPVAAAEDLLLRRRLAGLEGVLGELLAVASALRAIEDDLARLDPDARAALWDVLRPLPDDVAALAEEIAAFVMAEPSNASLVALHERLAALGREVEANGSDLTHEGVHLIVADRLRAGLHHLGRAADAQAFLLGVSRERPSTRLSFHRDTGQAGRNALRAFLAVALAGGFAIASAWSAGGTFLTNICVACSLFATQPRPSAAAFGFMRGAAFALVAAFAMKFYVLPFLDGFLMLALALGPVIAAATVATTVPGWLGTATAFNVLFLSNIAPINVMTYDPAAYLDGGVATLAAFLVGGTIFRIVLPADPLRTARRLAERLRGDLAVMASRGGRGRERRLPLMYDRVARIAAASPDLELVEGSISSLGVAVELARLRSLALPEGPRAIVAHMLDAMAERPPDHDIAAACQRAISELSERPQGDSPEVLRAVASLSSVRDAVLQHPGFYGNGPVA